MVDVLGRLPLIRPVPQPDEGVTYAAKIDKAEAHLDLSLAAEQVERAIRAFNPVPGAWVEIAGERLKILAADVTAESGSQIGRASCRERVCQYGVDIGGRRT